MKIAHAKVGERKATSRSKRLVTICAELGGPNEFMTITVAVTNDNSDEEARECGIARAKDFARQFADAPPQCFPDSRIGGGPATCEQGLERCPSSSAQPASAPGSTRTGLTTRSTPASRIYQSRGGPDSLRWFWSMTATAGPMTRSGRGATLEEAKAQLWKSWDAWKAWANLEEID